MSGKVTGMSMIKQLLQLYSRGLSNRAIARELGLDKETVNGYVRKIKANNFDIEALLQRLLSLSKYWKTLYWKVSLWPVQPLIPISVMRRLRN